MNLTDRLHLGELIEGEQDRLLNPRVRILLDAIVPIRT